MNDFHVPALLQEAIEFLAVKKDELYIDATLGGGGHTTSILEKGGKVLGLDADQEAIEYVQNKFKIQNLKFKIGEDVRLVHGNFRNIDEIAKQNEFTHVAGVLFDLGVSSHQLDTEERGFSFQSEGPLDMRMDRSLAVRAADLLNALSQKELYELFSKLGEERYAFTISKNIIRSRGIRPIQTTRDLVSIIDSAVNKGKGRSPVRQAQGKNIHSATRVFQALRIAVNDELRSLQEALPKALELLKPGGRLVVISFHSLEDRIVKNAFKEFEQKGKGMILTEKPIGPSAAELEKNIRVRSAKLRAFEKK